MGNVYPTHKTIPVDSVVEMAPAYGIKGIEVDGNDIIAVIDALKRRLHMPGREAVQCWLMLSHTE